MASCCRWPATCTSTAGASTGTGTACRTTCRRTCRARRSTSTWPSRSTARRCSSLYTHPLNRLDLPYRTITGLVDNDRYHDVFTHIPAVWTDPDFVGTLPAGTPIAQCVPIRRQTLELETAAMTPEELRVFLDATNSINENPGEYKRLYRVAR